MSFQPDYTISDSDIRFDIHLLVLPSIMVVRSIIYQYVNVLAKDMVYFLLLIPRQVKVTLRVSMYDVRTIMVLFMIL